MLIAHLPIEKIGDNNKEKKIVMEKIEIYTVTC